MGMASLFAKEGSTGPADFGDPLGKTSASSVEPLRRGLSRTAELLALVLHHPATHHTDKVRARDLLSELESELSPQDLAAAMARGRARELQEVAAEILGMR
jgi:hypothetical protein